MQYNNDTLFTSAPFRAEYINRNPESGTCTVTSINWDKRILSMTNGAHTYFPTFDEVRIWRLDSSPERPIVFLDVDGVLNRCADSGFGLESAKIELLSLIVSATNPRVVISSTWRNKPHQMTRLGEALRYAGVRDFETTALTEDGTSGNLILGKTRYQEIKDWLDDNGNPNNFVVVDDDITTIEFGHKCVLTDSYQGLTSFIADTIIRKLKHHEQTTS